MAAWLPRGCGEDNDLGHVVQEDKVSLPRSVRPGRRVLLESGGAHRWSSPLVQGWRGKGATPAKAPILLPCLASPLNATGAQPPTRPFSDPLTVHPKKTLFEVKLLRPSVCFATGVETNPQGDLQRGGPGGAKPGSLLPVSPPPLRAGGPVSQHRAPLESSLPEQASSQHTIPASQESIRGNAEGERLGSATVHATAPRARKAQKGASKRAVWCVSCGI